jgi:hypothetical protein
MKTKFNKESRNLMIAILLGDGSISATNGFRMTHCEKQKDYLVWKIKQLNNYGIKNCGLKSYISTKGYKVGEEYWYTRLNTIMFTKVLRRVFYKPKKVIANRKMLNRLNALGLAIWYMDDGHINHRKIAGRVCGFYIKIAICLPKTETQIIIDYFKEVWNVSFYMFSEGKGTYSICCGTQEGIKFIDVIKPYVNQVPSMRYKISYNLKDRIKSISSSKKSEMGNTLLKGEDIIWSLSKDKAVNNLRGMLSSIPEQHV